MKFSVDTIDNALDFILFIGVRAYVDVRSRNDNHSQAVSDELRKLGAVVCGKFLPSVTHVIFKDGSKASVTKAARYGAHLVTVHWIERCAFPPIFIGQRIFHAIVMAYFRISEIFVFYSCKTNNERVSEFIHAVELNNSGKKVCILI